MTGDQPNVALVSGEAGIGKTRLVREALAALPADVTAIGVSAQPGSMSRPLDAVAALVPAGVADEEQADAVLASIRAAVQRGPTILVIEDLHWIDAASANLIDRIAQQPWPNLVLVATYRPTDLVRGQPGGELVLRLERRHSVEQIRLERLCRTDVGAMVAAISAVTRQAPSSAMVETLFRRSSGVPFVVEELLRAAGPQAIVSDLLEADLPWSLEEAVRQQVAELEHGHRRLVEALAVYGRSASFDALRIVTEAAEDELLDDLRALAAAGSSSRRATTSSGSRTPSSPRRSSISCSVGNVGGCTSGASRRSAWRRCSTTPRWPATPRAPVATTRCRRSPARARRVYLQQGFTFAALRLAAEGLGEAPNDPELLAVATEAAWRLDFQDEALDAATRWARVAVEVADRIEATRFVARLHHELGDDVGVGRRAGRARAARRVARRRPAARRGGGSRRPGPHDQRPCRRGPRLGGTGARRRPGVGRLGDGGKGTRRAGRIDGDERRAPPRRVAGGAGRGARRGSPRRRFDPARRGPSTTGWSCSRRTRRKRPRCAPRCRTSAARWGSTSWGPAPHCCGRSTPPSVTATWRRCAASSGGYAVVGAPRHSRPRWCRRPRSTTRSRRGG